MEKFKINDRVRRRPFLITLPIEPEDMTGEMNGETPVTTTSVRGCIGTVKAVREETTLANHETRERTIMVHVSWDNGTLSYLGPDGLEVVN